MRKSRCFETQIVLILKKGESGLGANEIYCKHGIRTATYYKWRFKYGCLKASKLQCIKELEAENAKLKRMYADKAMEAVQTLALSRPRSEL